MAQPPGRADPPGESSNGLRVVRVYNVDDEDVPPFGAMELTGWDVDRRAFKIRRCTVTGRNDLIFNGLTPIPSGLEGQANADAHVPAGYVPADGDRPRPGEVWGVKAGEWLLRPYYTGYTIVDTTTADRGFCVITSQRANITEFVRVTGTTTPLGTGSGSTTLPPDWVSGELVFYDSLTAEWGTESPNLEVYFRDLNGVKGFYSAAGEPCYVHVNRVGFAYGRPVYVGRGDCSTTTSTTTTTTGSPCTGSCQWTYNFTTKVWEKDGDDCGTGCHCMAPTWCPPTYLTEACTDTVCARLDADQEPVNCTGTTTTGGPCATTTSSACAAGCEWYCHPVRGWILESYGCTAACPCSAPATGCGPGNACATAATACEIPMPYCSGTCRWVWLTSPDRWELYSNSCSSSGVPVCGCDPPTGTGADCGNETFTACYSPSGVPCSTPTTTTQGPGCAGSCLWGTSDGSAWDTLLRYCPGCDCAPATGVPADTCGQTESACVPFGTTTTTTTAGPTTTTTTASGTTTTTAACSVCTWKCESGTWNLTQDCVGPNCTCPGDPDEPDDPTPIFYCWKCTCGFGFPTCPGRPNGIYYSCADNDQGPCSGNGSSEAVSGPHLCGVGADCGLCGTGLYDCPPSGFPCTGGLEGVFINVDCVGSTTTTTTAAPTTTTTTTTASGLTTAAVTTAAA